MIKPINHNLSARYNYGILFQSSLLNNLEFIKFVAVIANMENW